MGARTVGPQAAERDPTGAEGGVTDSVRRLVCARRAEHHPLQPERLGGWVTTCWAIPWAEGEKVGDPGTPSDAEPLF